LVSEADSRHTARKGGWDVRSLAVSARLCTTSLAGGGRGELISEISPPLTARVLRASEGARLC
jgi:hypothetical protein